MALKATESLPNRSQASLNVFRLAKSASWYSPASMCRDLGNGDKGGSITVPTITDVTNSEMASVVGFCPPIATAARRSTSMNWLLVSGRASLCIFLILEVLLLLYVDFMATLVVDIDNSRDREG
eukprot:CAMPEP_0194758760 /NCGR_PEP_ID=MMETSP0323_2-20130528/11963_1 /TAXON_ID=2866 ORGANISM="Crypthecodinium cohnii, Strain Seligo" /NCGR_SAMPLE_ID=MMETSP0323_2 /ASSEMBLY_ACC=CAM_ASM_000346 /LENGTH=123 /DNA_ID=CAMNT_0039679207 /DNA_START=387 /DNA_END=758 /DNA_ORIENTATION=-